MNRAVLGAIVTAFTLAAGPVHAGELRTSRLDRGNSSTGRGLLCYGTNVGKKPIALMTTQLVFDGSVPNECVDLPPGGTCLSAEETVAAAPCKVAFTGGAKNVRAAIAVYDTATGETLAVEPAR
jgi:hypothetical protein